MWYPFESYLCPSRGERYLSCVRRRSIAPWKETSVSHDHHDIHEWVCVVCVYFHADIVRTKTFATLASHVCSTSTRACVSWTCVFNLRLSKTCINVSVLRASATSSQLNLEDFRRFKRRTSCSSAYTWRRKHSSFLVRWQRMWDRLSRTFSLIQMLPMITRSSYRGGFGRLLRRLYFLAGAFTDIARDDRWYCTALIYFWRWIGFTMWAGGIVGVCRKISLRFSFWVCLYLSRDKEQRSVFYIYLSIYIYVCVCVCVFIDLSCAYERM